MVTTVKVESLESVADLEICGLSVRSIQLLDRMGYVLIADLVNLTERELLSQKCTGPQTVEDIRTSLRNYQNGLAVKSVRECVEIQGQDEDW